MKFSVIITCYNEGAELLRAVRSVQDQTYTDFEIIVVKDFSAHQATLDACKQLEAEGIRVLYADTNVGLSVTRNMGIAAAKGDVIYTLDGDDELPADALEIIAGAFDKNLDADVVFGNYELIERDSSKIVNCARAITDGKYLQISGLIASGFLPLGQNAIRRQIANLYPYSQRYSYGCQDVELKFRMLEHNVKYVYIPHTLYRWYKKPTGMNSSLKNAQSLDMCYYEHMPSVAPFLSHRYVLSLCKQFQDVERYRFYFHQYAPSWCRWAKYFPFPILVKFQRFVK